MTVVPSWNPAAGTTREAHAEYLHRLRADCFRTVQPNQPTLLAGLTGLPWADVPTTGRVERGHGRRVHRSIKIATVVCGIGFPHAAWAF